MPERAVSRIYGLKDQAERALDALIAGGIPGSSISVLMFDPALREPAAAAGHGTGIGGTIGVLAGAGFITIAGVGRVIGAGPVMAGLGSADAQKTGELLRALR